MAVLYLFPWKRLDIRGYSAPNSSFTERQKDRGLNGIWRAYINSGQL